VGGGVTATNAGTQPAVRIRPSANDGPAEIYFSRRADGSGNSAGDTWVIGHAGFGAGAGNFGIGTGGPGVCLSINANGTVNLPYGLFIGGQQAATKPWVAGHFDGTTSASVPLLSDTGWRGISSVSRTGVGVYVVSWAGAHPRGDGYSVFANMNATAGFLSWDRTSTSLTLRATTNAAVPQDPAEINFMIP
jgi:hypothetical protein